MTVEASGGCHCGAVRFRCELDGEPVPALSCNCSICSATGFIHLIVAHDRFVLERGEEAITHYRFGTGVADHMFCKVCGVKSFYQPRSHPEAWSVNANALDERPDLAITPFDGKNWEQAKAALDASDHAD